MVKEVPIYAVVFCCFIFPAARSEATCRIPKAPENGSVQVTDERKVGTLAHYSCDVNATLVGESVSRCLPSGIWSSDAPKCLRSCYVSEIEDGQVGKYEWKNQFTRKIFISFPEGKSIKHHEKVIILCKDEYIPGNQETGRSQEVECIDGSWTEPLFCRPKISCEMPETPKHGSLQLSDKLKVGTLAFFSCVDGATLVGVTTTKCLPSGKWSFDPPTCLLSCRGSPPVVENADAVILNDKDGGNVTYQCNEGFEKFKEETVVCDSGIWKGNLPACRRIFCLDSPPTNENAHVVSVVSKHEGRVTYRCHEDFEKIENETVVCDFGTWKGNPPICKRKYLSCDPFPVSPDIDVIYTNGVRVRSIARFTCLNGTSLIGSERARCLSIAKWSHPMPRCAASCDSSPPSAENAHVVALNAKHGGRVTYICNEDFEKIENETVVCDFGIWKGNPPVCKRENCTVPVLPHGDMRERKLGDLFFSWRSLRYETQVSYEKIPAGNVTSNNVTVTLFCPRKYVFQGTSLRNAEITCVKGLWKPNPVCVRDYSCDHFPNSPELTIRYTKGVQVGSVAFFTCFNSTSLIGNSVARCLSNGSWSHSLPSCEENCTVPVLPHGDMRERKLGDPSFSWRSFLLKGQVSYEKIPAGNVISNNVTVTLFCPKKYVFQGTSLRNAEITCVKGLWKPNPICVRENCTVPVLPHGDMTERKLGEFFFNWRSFRYERQVSYEKIPPGTVVTNNSSLMLFCPPQYSFKGTSLSEREITCINGLWNPDPVCIPTPPCLIDDILSVLPENVLPDVDSGDKTFPYNTAVKLKCDGRMILEGEAIGKCNRKGEWDIGNVQCVIGCSKPVIDPNSSLIFTPHKEVYKTFEMVTLSCPPGMRLTSITERIMCLIYSWSENVLPDCQ